MNEVREMTIQIANNSSEKCVVEIAKSEPWKVALSHSSLGRLEFEADNLCKALVCLRYSLEEKECKLLCNGSRKDVIVSGMSRQMGGGRKAYVVRLGCQALKEDMVDIFDYAEPQYVGTVSQQKEFYNEWVLSLGNE